ncbi:MAG: MFS transporter [Candidatus Hodarchaeota archaeon]
MSNNRSFYIMCFAVVINMIVASTTWIVLPVYLKDRGATEMDVGGLMGVVTLTGALLALPFGEISDRVGRKPVILFSLLGYSLSWIIILFYRSIQWFYVSMIVRGPFILLTSAVTAFIADLFEPEKRGRMLGIYQAVSGAGSIIGPVTSGLLIASFFYDGYFLFATITALVSLFFAFLIKESKADVIRLGNYFKRLKGK